MTRTQTRRMGAAEWTMLLVLSVVWGGAFFFYKVLDEAGLPPFTIVLGRVGLAAIVLLGVVAATRRSIPRDPRILIAFLLLGALNNVIPFSLITIAEQRIDSGLASIFNATTPLFTALLAHAFSRDEKLSAAKVAGVVIGVCGVVALIGPGALHRLDLKSLAQLASVGAAVVYAVAAVYARRFRGLGVDPIVLSTGQLCASTILSLPLVLIFEHPWTLQAPPAYVWWSLLGIALLSTAFAFVLYFSILERAGATNAAAVTFLVPISAVLLGTLFLHERLSPSMAAGMALIFAGLAALDGRVFALFALFARRAQRVAADDRSEVHGTSTGSG